MSGRLFDNISGEKNDVVEEFLKHFPPDEIWRFFVEQDRYDCRIYLYKSVYNLLLQFQGNKPNENASFEEMQKTLSKYTIRELEDFSRGCKDEDKLYDIIDFLNANDKPREPVLKCIDRQRGWLGFEVREPNYLQGAVSGFCLILQRLKSGLPLDLNFIDELHKACTNNVKNMIGGTEPGKYREGGAGWDFVLDCNTLSGLTESLAYLKKLANSGPPFNGKLFRIKIKSRPNIIIDDFQNIDVDKKAEEIWRDAKIHPVEFEALATSHTIAAISEKLLNEYQENIKNVTKKEDKLHAIFTFIKNIVLHHPFKDGVGRTYSMLLLQYLLMSQNLLPCLIFDSNIIPGYSVNELTQLYLDHESKMEKILKDPKFISSNEFTNQKLPFVNKQFANIDTNEFLASLEPLEPNGRKYFSDAITLFKNAKEAYFNNPAPTTNM